jgi:hypothetical protein
MRIGGHAHNSFVSMVTAISVPALFSTPTESEVATSIGRSMVTTGVARWATSANALQIPLVGISQ